MSGLDFEVSLAVVIGIDRYRQGIAPLRTAVADARAIAQTLQQDHGYQVICLLNEQAQLATLNSLIQTNLPRLLTANSRLLLYFAGHGIAQNSDDGPVGYLIPQDATAGKPSSYLPMVALHDALTALPCRHFLAVFDCCFAGAFRWSSTRDIDLSQPIIHQERFDRFRQEPAWQVITSAAHDQKAMDVITLQDNRGEVGHHSPFAAALISALQGAADTSPPAQDEKPAGDGVLTATELYIYLRDTVELATADKHTRQTPELCALRKHGKGEFIFLTPGHELNLPPAPELNKKNNPYRGLESFNTEHADLFYGRRALIRDLTQFTQEHSLTVVLGPSGTGKSSLVKAGLIPALQQESKESKEWKILPVIRPGESPLKALAKAILLLRTGQTQIGTQVAQIEALSAEFYQSPEAIINRITSWQNTHPQQRLLLVFDQFEEVVTLCEQEKIRQQLFALLQLVTSADNPLANPLANVVITLRSDFEPQLLETALKPTWMSSRFLVPPMSRDELRQVIEQPAAKRVLYFEPPVLIERLLDEVIQTPGALPLLSFTLSELYFRYLERRSDNRALTEEDYEDLGGIAGSLTQRATQEYEKLVQLDAKYGNTIRNVMLRMVSVEGGELARRRVRDTELVYVNKAENQRVQEHLKQFIQARLLVRGQTSTGNAYVEPAHDALVRGWHKLMQWTRKAQAEMLLKQPVTLAATAWENKQGTLWHSDRRLALLEETLNSEKCWLNRSEAAFVKQSIQTKRKRIWFRWIGFATTLSLSVGIGLFIDSLRTSAELKERAYRALSWISTGRSTEGLMLAVNTLNQSENAAADVQLIAQKTLMNAVQQAREQNILQHKDGVRAVDYAPNNRYAVSGGTDLKLRLWDAKTGQLLSVFNQGDDAHSKIIQSIDISSDGESVVSASTDGTLRFWDAKTGQPIGDEIKGHTEAIYSVDFSPDGAKIVSTSGTNLRLWNVQTGQPIGDEIEGHEDTVFSVAFSPNGKYFASGSVDKQIRLWDAQTGKPIGAMKGHEDAVFSISFSADSQRIVSGSADRTVRLWNTQTLQPIGWPLVGHDGEVYAAKFGLDDQTILSTGADRTIRLWHSKTLTPIRTISEAHNDIIWALALSKDGRQMMSSSSDATVKLWDINTELPTGQPFKTSHKKSILSIALSPDGNQLATASLDETVRLWEPQSAKPGKKLKGHDDPVRSIVFHPNGQWLFSGSDDGTIRQWDVATGNPMGDPWIGHGGGGEDVNVYAIAINAKGDRLVSSGGDGTIRLWDVGSQQQIGLGDSHTDWVYSVAFSHNGKYIVSGSKDNTIVIWDAQSVQPILALPLKGDSGHGDNVWAVAFSPDDRYIASGSKDKTIQIWNAQTGKPVGESLKGHTNTVWTVAFSPDGRTLASGSNDKTIRLWDVTNMEQVKPLGPPLEGHTESVWSVKFSPDGKSLVSGSADLSFRWWPSRWNHWPQMACDRLGDHPMLNAPENVENLDQEMLQLSEETKAACDRKFWQPPKNDQNSD